VQTPWVFDRRDEIGKEERLKTLEKHLKLFKSIWEGVKRFNTQKKYVKMYISGFEGAQELRMKFMECEDVDEILGLLKTIL
jgi:tRNA-dihydrouridine synthase